MNKHSILPSVFFNASVILSGLRSPSGGSAKILTWIQDKKIHPVVSETIVDEAIRNAYKLHMHPAEVERSIHNIFFKIYPTPSLGYVKKYEHLVTDVGDVHVLASCKEHNVDWLVTLDKKHLLILQKKIRWVRIVSPKELLEKLSIH